MNQLSISATYVHRPGGRFSIITSPLPLEPDDPIGTGLLLR